MVWEQNVHIVIMVTSLEERGKVWSVHLKSYCYCLTFFFLNLTQPKCDQYWPEDAENPLSFDSLSISQLNETDFETYTLRSFQIKRVSDQTIIYCGTTIIANTFSQNGKSRTVKQAYLKGWPDFGVPDNPEILIRFIEVVRILAKETPKTQASNSNQPIVVHCR